MGKSEHIEHTLSKHSTLNKEELQHALETCYGNITLIAKKLGAARNTIYKHIDKYELNKELRHSRKIVVERIQSKLMEALEHEDPRVYIPAATVLLRHFQVSRNDDEQNPMMRSIYEEL